MLINDITHNTYPNRINRQLNFEAMKKSQFVGIDRFVVESFKAPIEKFNAMEDFQNWSKDLAKKFKKKNLLGRTQETTVQRKSMIKEWFDYITKENKAYSWATRLLILAGITSGLKKDEDTIPAVLNKGVLADTISNAQQDLTNNPKFQFNFDTTYRNNLRSFYMDNDVSTSYGTDTKWVIIPSKKHDEKNFEANVEKLKMLSHKSWCTKSLNAEPYLAQGDFHIYLENGKPKLGVRFVGNSIQEIQGPQNNSRIPLEYLDLFKKHINENNYRLTANARDEVKTSEKTQQRINKIKNDIAPLIKNKDYIAIFKYFNIPAKELPNGMLEIGYYCTPNSLFTWKDIGVDENKLFENVERISGHAEFKDTNITTFKKLKCIEGDAHFYHSNVISLGSLEEIKGSVNLVLSKVTSLGELKKIGGDARFGCTEITSLNKLEHVGGDLFINNVMSDLGQLEHVGGTFYCDSEELKSLCNIKYIGGDVKLDSVALKSLGALEHIGGNLVLDNNSKINNLGNLKRIDGTLDARFYSLKSLGNLEYIGNNAMFYGAKIKTLDKLKYIGGDADFCEAKITSLGKLQKIGGKANFESSLITTLGKLDEIGGDAVFSFSKITSLDKLKKIGGNAFFNYSKVTDLGKLSEIGGQAVLCGSKLSEKDLPKGTKTV